MSKLEFKLALGFLLIVCCLMLLVFFLTVIKPQSKVPVSTIRYHCDDDVDTTKGAVKGVLTNCKPIVIERRT